MDQQKGCLNCGVKRDGDFCPSCGQRASVSRVSFREIGSQISSTVFNLEAPLYQTFKGLLTRPGAMISEFLGGKRKS
ncbi:MAG: DUF3667 domain-containing protein, partial [Flavobacteriales bacterium]|nr:DUF3667 domain-containing protein [Flavobacteriales bacterium]